MTKFFDIDQRDLKFHGEYLIEARHYSYPVNPPKPAKFGPVIETQFYEASAELVGTAIAVAMSSDSMFLLFSN